MRHLVMVLFLLTSFATLFLAPPSPATQAATPAQSSPVATISAASSGSIQGKIVFATDKGLYLIDADGSHLTQIPIKADLAAFEAPAWSPDGKHIAFSAYGEGTNIYSVDPDGSHLARLTTVTDTLKPAWSPDGKRIAYWYTVGGYSEVHVMNADGSHAFRLTHTGGGRRPSWSPDGKRIVYLGSNKDGRDNIYIIDANGTRPVMITNTANDKWDTAWSPDGKRIAFAMSDDNNDLQHLYLIDPDGKNLTQLTRMDKEVSYCPAWSPDGKYLIFTSVVNKRSEIFRVDASGANVVQITNKTVEDRISCPSWFIPKSAATPAATRAR